MICVVAHALPLQDANPAGGAGNHPQRTAKECAKVHKQESGILPPWQNHVNPAFPSLQILRRWIHCDTQPSPDNLALASCMCFCALTNISGLVVDPCEYLQHRRVRGQSLFGVERDTVQGLVHNISTTVHHTTQHRQKTVGIIHRFVATLREAGAGEEQKFRYVGRAVGLRVRVVPERIE